jgi:hypothetical protein
MTEISSDIAFTPTVKALQSRQGSRANYARMEARGGWRTSITPDLVAFLAAQTSAFLATVNAEGQGFFYDSKAQAVAAVQAMQARGVKSIDVGCMQINLMYHPTAFASLDEAFDPMANARYAAKFLGILYGQTRDWAKATAMYHSATPELGENYQRKVLALLKDEGRRGLPAGGTFVEAQGGDKGPRMMPVPAMGGYQLSNKAEAARVILAPQGTAGRGLDAYRATPIRVASRMATPSRF